MIIRRPNYAPGQIRFERVELLSGSHPVALRRAHCTVDAVEFHVRETCARYDNCMSHAAGEGWPAWSCTRCEVNEVIGDAEANRDFVPLMKLLVKILGVKTIAELTE